MCHTRCTQASPHMCFSTNSRPHMCALIATLSWTQTKCSARAADFRVLTSEPMRCVLPCPMTVSAMLTQCHVCCSITISARHGVMYTGHTCRMDIITMVVVRLSKTALMPKVSSVINQAKVGRWSALCDAANNICGRWHAGTCGHLSGQHTLAVAALCEKHAMVCN